MRTLTWKLYTEMGTPKTGLRGTVCLWALLWLFSPLAIASALSDGARITTMEKLTRLSLPLSSGGSFRLIQEPGLTRLELRGTELARLQSIRGRGDLRVKGVEVLPQGLNGAELRLPHALEGIQAFAYQQKNELVIDLWAEKEAGSSPKASASMIQPEPKAKQVAIVARSSQGSRKRANASDRRPADTQSAKAETTEEVVPLKMGQDLFQRFSMPNPPLRYSSKGAGIDLPPSLGMESIRPLPKLKAEDAESEAYVLARSLYTQKKFGLAIKAIEIALRDYPSGRLNLEFLYLDSLARMALSEELKAPTLKNQAEAALRQLADQRVDGKPVVPFFREIRLYFGLQQFSAENWLAAIDDLESVSKSMNSSDPNYLQLKFLLAEAYGAAKESRRAERIYRYLEERHGSHYLGKEAAYRKIGLLARELNYDRVIEEGIKALERLPEHSKVRGEVFFLLGEAFFWKGDLARSEENFKKFVTDSAVNTMAGLALVRMGELAELRRGDLEEARKRYLEAKNRYPFSSGDLVATVRLARLDIHREKDPEFIVKTLREMLADPKTALELRQIAELTLADYLLLAKKHEEAIALTQSGMAKYDGSPREAYRRAFSKSLFHQLAAFNEEKKPAAALALFKEQKQWLELYGPAVHREMAKAYQDIGLLALANESNERFLKERGGGRMLASDARALTFEKAENAFAKGEYGDVLRFLDHGGSLSAPEKLLRIKTLNQLKRQREAYEEARSLIRSKNEEELSAKDWVFLVEPLTEQAERTRDYPQLESDLRALNRKLEEPQERLWFAIADSIWMQRKHGEAVQEISAALEKFPKGERAQRARYQLGMSYLALKKRDEAVKALTAARDGDPGLWSDSAGKELELIDWEKKYSSVLRGLPPSGLGLRGNE